MTSHVLIATGGLSRVALPVVYRTQYPDDCRMAKAPGFMDIQG
jgi:hypothetical protein